MKVYAVVSVWSYDGCPDDFANVYEEHIDKIFDSESKAIDHVRDLLRKIIETTDAEDPEGIVLKEVPNYEEIKEKCLGNTDLEYCSYWDEHSSYRIDVYEVE